MYSLKPEKTKKNAIKNYIKENNFDFDSDYEYTYKQSWMASECTVFYYSKESKIHAEQIAFDLEKLTGKEFKVRIGAGLGVSKGKKATTFFVHYIE